MCSFDKCNETNITCACTTFFCEVNQTTLLAILSCFQFLCAVEESKQVYNDLLDKFPNKVLSSEQEYVPRTLVSLSDERTQQAEKLVDRLEHHEDVVRVYDNIEGLPSASCKLFGSTITS